MPRKITTKTAAISSMSLLLIIVISLFAWSWMSRNTYHQDLIAHQQQLEQRLQRANHDIEDNSDNADFMVGRYLETLRQDLHKLAEQLPSPPRVLSVSLLNSDQQQQLDKLNQAYTQADQQLDMSSQLAGYQYQLTPFIKKLHQGQGSNATQQTELAKTWQQVHQDISNIIVPHPSQNFSQSLLQTIDNIAHDLSDLSEIYKKIDQPAFLERKDQLNDKFDAFAKLADDHIVIIKEQDTQLQQSLDQLLTAYE